MIPDRVVYFFSHFALRLRNLRQLEAADRDRQQNQCDSQTNVRHLDRGRLVQAIGLQRVGRQRPYFVHSLRRCTQNQKAAEERREESSQRVEGLGQIQTTGGGLRLAQHRHVRIGRHLQTSDAGRKDDERNQE